MTCIPLEARPHSPFYLLHFLMLPPFTEATARQKVQMAEDAWNTRDPERVALAYTEDTEWCNRAEFLRGRAEVVAFLQRKWARELDYRLRKTLWAFTGNRIAVRFESHMITQPMNTLRSDTPIAVSPAASQNTPILGHSHYGQGREKVMVFHDWMGDSANYEPLIPYLDPRPYTYVFADVRGYGKSRHLAGDYSVDEVAADAFRLADKLDWHRFHLIGHSMTGMVVQRMALDDWTSGAKRLKRVVAITPVSADG